MFPVVGNLRSGSSNNSRKPTNISSLYPMIVAQVSSLIILAAYLTAIITRAKNKVLRNPKGWNTIYTSFGGGYFGAS